MVNWEPSTEPAVLTSWKEVASYIGKGVRTAQRWEKYDGLPIRRIVGTSKIVVKREELDHWLKSQPTQNSGPQSKSIDLAQLSASVAEARNLRLQNVQLRNAVRGAMQQLIDECRRMCSGCGVLDRTLE